MKYFKIFFLAAFIFNFQLLIASDPIPARKQEKAIALVNGTIHTVSGNDIEKGTVVFDKGKIIAVGNSAAIPADAEVIDVSGKHIYPGLINAASYIGLQEIESVRGTLDLVEVGKINPNIRTEISVNPESELIPTTRANGVTISHIIPGGNLIAGRTSAIMMDGWTQEDLVLKAPIGLYIQFPEMIVNRSPRARQTEEEQKKNIEKNLAELRNAFADARAYMKAKKINGEKQLTDLRWEAMISVFEKKIPIIVRADEITQLQSAIQFAKDEDVKLILHGGRDAWKVTHLLKDNAVSVIIGSIHELPNKRAEDFDNPFTIAKKLYDANILFAISGEGNSAMGERNIAYQAATAAAYGLPKESALRSVTLNAAKILGIDNFTGSIEIGKDATLIVTNGDPLEIMTNVEMEFIQGRKIDLRSRHTQLYEKYKERYKQLGIMK